MRTRLLIILLIAVAIPLQAATIRVPQDQATIQAGINVAADGDSILVTGGTYSENLSLLEKSISIISAAGSESTLLLPFIAAQDLLYVQIGIDETVLIKGFSFTNSIGANCIEAHSLGNLTIQDNMFYGNQPPLDDNSGSVIIFGSCNVTGNTFDNNSGGTHGGGLRLDGSGSAIVERNVFRNNSATYGAAINLLHRSQATIRYNLLHDNTAFAYGGGIYVANATGILVHNNTIVRCASGNNGGGGICFGGSAGDSAYNNIIVDCIGYGIWGGNSPETLSDYNDVFSNDPADYYMVTQGSQNISTDPMFIGGFPYDYRLQSNSPGINAGDPNPIYNDPDGSRNDIGAFPFVTGDTRKEVPAEYPTIQSAIDAAVDGDTVLVSDGTYLEHISFLSKAITVGSIVLLDGDTLHTLNTIIDGDWDSASVVTIEGFSLSPVFIGFTVTNSAGSGIQCVNSDAKILNCILNGNSLDAENGSSISLRDSKLFNCGINGRQESMVKLAHCFVAGDIVGSQGGIYVAADSSVLDNVYNPRGTFVANYCQFSGEIGGARSIDLTECLVDGPIGYYDGEMTALNCRLADISGNSDTQAQIKNSLVVGEVSIGITNISHSTISGTIFGSFGVSNLTIDSSNVFLEAPILISHTLRSVYAHCSNIFANGSAWLVVTSDTASGYWLDTTNVFSTDPLFCDTSISDYSLRENSPCIAANNSCQTLLGAYGAACPAIPETRNVPGEYVSIQSAINASYDGDTVLVDDGHYYERISFLGKKITVASDYLLDQDLMHIYQTIIDGDTTMSPPTDSDFSVVKFAQDEDSLSRLVGFTITGGAGHGVSCLYSSPTIRRNRIQANSLHGINLLAAPRIVLITNCQISGNSGSGIFRTAGPGFRIMDCEITGNLLNGIETNSSGEVKEVTGCRMAYNGEMGIETYYSVKIEDCVIEHNWGGVGLGYYGNYFEEPDSLSVDKSPNSVALIRNVIIRANHFGTKVHEYDWTFDSCLVEDNELFGIGAGTDSWVTVQNSIVRNNGNGEGSGAGIRTVGGPLGDVHCKNTLFENNHARVGGALGGYRTASFIVENCTFVSNRAQFGSVLYQTHDFHHRDSLFECVIASNLGGPVLFRPFGSDTSTVADSILMRIDCTDIFGNEGGDWIDLMESQANINGNFSLNPLFCDTASGDYRIKDSSPCAPANNSCGVLIGANGIGCANIAPELTSADSATVIKRTPFVYHSTSTDIDGPTAIYSFANLPAWMSSDGDSAFGTPGLNDSDSDIIAIVSDGFLADSQIVHVSLIETPLVGAPRVDGSGNPLHVIANAPQIEWSYLDPPGLFPQTSFEIAVSTDNDWQFAEMWNPAPFAFADTFVVYNGAPLLDGQTYWLRLRVSNSLGWSNWSELIFRMNSVPTLPQLRQPENNTIVATQFPDLTILNPIDAESDSMLLTFEISADSFATSPQVFEISPDTDSLTTVAVPVQLDENTRYWWRVTSSDYYEESAYSPIWSFWINSNNTAPSAFSLLSPPNALSPTLPDNTPEFTWQPSFELDPGDSAKFTLLLSIDSTFSFASQIPDLTNPQYTPTNPLEWGRRYWWRVKAEDQATGLTWSNEVFSFAIMMLGDPDGNGVVTISDVVFIINFIFAGGQAPNPIEGADSDCNGIVTISDAVYLIQFIFAGGSPPCQL